MHRRCPSSVDRFWTAAYYHRRNCRVRLQLVASSCLCCCCSLRPRNVCMPRRTTPTRSCPDCSACLTGTTTLQYSKYSYRAIVASEINNYVVVLVSGVWTDQQARKLPQDVFVGGRKRSNPSCPPTPTDRGFASQHVHREAVEESCRWPLFTCVCCRERSVYKYGR